MRWPEELGRRNLPQLWRLRRRRTSQTVATTTMGKMMTRKLKIIVDKICQGPIAEVGGVSKHEALKSSFATEPSMQIGGVMQIRRVRSVSLGLVKALKVLN